MADQTEEALFGLQELTCGIYPWCLVDQGLRAALEPKPAAMLQSGTSLRGRPRHQALEAAPYYHYIPLETMPDTVSTL
ncbi:hypothetical protein ACQPW3_11430 [Actinosynnema sp. CA-248983]